MKNQITTKIQDTSKGIFATVTTPEGIFNLKLTFVRGLNNKRECVITGNYPEDLYDISYQGGLVVLKKGGSFTVNQKIIHRAFGKGVITSVNDNAIIIDFNGTIKCMQASILKNFLK
jgi:hypothetical protein